MEIDKVKLDLYQSIYISVYTCDNILCINCTVFEDGYFILPLISILYNVYIALFLGMNVYLW